jgi:hypothetical protein
MQIMIKRAHISEDGKYRYTLYREWDESKPTILFIMLKPSTADDKKNDNTVDCVVDYSKSWGYGGVHVVNLYAKRNTDIKELKSTYDPREKDNLSHIQSLIGCVDKVIYAWGCDGDKKEPQWLRNIVSTPYCLSINANGTPRQPLRARKELKPVLYRSQLKPFGI